MKRELFKFLLPLALGASIGVTAQNRYLDEVFTDNEILTTTDVTYGVNVDWLRTNTNAAQSVLVTEITEIKTALAMGNPIPTKYYLTNDATTPNGDSTAVKVTPVKMDIYEPDPNVDTETERVVMVYIHTGNYLPPPFNGQPTGRKDDLTGIELCKQWAKRGFVAVSIDYRLGWNPISSDAAVRRGTLLNAVYRSIHDVKQGVRYLRDDADNANTYGIDKDNVILYGQGSGAYTALGYATLDKNSEMEIPKFIDPNSSPSSSYINRTLVGEIDGTGGVFNLYSNPTAQSSDIQMVINAGGALADSSWLEAGDAPMVTLHCVRDQFAPFENGVVIVTTTGEQVVEVQGPNIFMPKANKLGNNSAFYNNTWTDPYTTTAKAKYGKTYSYWHPVQTTITVEQDMEGCFPVIKPLVTLAQAPLQNQASPWEYWDPNSPLATAVVGQDGGGNPVTAHQASLLSNPDMSETKAKTYIDTIQGYIIPRIGAVLKANGLPIGVEENGTAAQYFTIYPNPAGEVVRFNALQEIEVKQVSVLDVSGRLVKTINGNKFTGTLSLENLESGVYFLRIDTNKGLLTERLIKQ